MEKHPILAALDYIKLNPTEAGLPIQAFEKVNSEPKEGDITAAELIEASQMMLTDRELTHEEAEASAQIVNLIAEATNKNGREVFIEILRSLKKEENWQPVKEKAEVTES